jgi:hypothetical protein
MGGQMLSKLLFSAVAVRQLGRLIHDVAARFCFGRKFAKE